LKRTLIGGLVAATAAVLVATAVPAQAAVSDCAGATVVVSGDNVVPLGQGQYPRTVAVDVTRPVGCTADYRLSLPALSGLSAVNGTTIALSSAQLSNIDAGVAQTGTITFSDGVVSLTKSVAVTPQRWTKISTNNAEPEPIDGGGSTLSRARASVVSWNTNTYGAFASRQHRLRVYQVSPGGQTWQDVTGVIVRSGSDGLLVKWATLGTDTQTSNSLYGLRFTYGGNSVEGFAPAVGGGDPAGVLVLGQD
jgi:hypothetical protein